MRKTKLKPGLAGLSPELQQAAAKAIAQAKKETNENSNPKALQGST